jgi:hypothetical protein
MQLKPYPPMTRGIWNQEMNNANKNWIHLLRPNYEECEKELGQEENLDATIEGGQKLFSLFLLFYHYHFYHYYILVWIFFQVRKVSVSWEKIENMAI